MFTKDLVISNKMISVASVADVLKAISDKKSLELFRIVALVNGTDDYHSSGYQRCRSLSRRILATKELSKRSNSSRVKADLT